ncbi:shikimate kinase [Fibrobacteria bacterium R8-3-H12]
MKSKVTNKFVLIGIPNCGKSTIGRRAAEKLQIPFYDTDKLAYERLNLDNPAEMFLYRNLMRIMEEHRKLETELAKLKGPAIIEIYPESVVSQPDMEALKKLGTIIHIKRDLKTMLEEAGKKKRKLVLRNMTTGHEINMQAETIRLYAEEFQHFEKLADLALDNDGTEDDAVEKLVAMIQNQKA